jgi:hypothetical protein
MLKSLHFDNVGPSRKLDITFARRLNVLTGDNGLGKSFVLDSAWALLTGADWRSSVTTPRGVPDASIRAVYEMLEPLGDCDGGEWSFKRGDIGWARTIGGATCPVFYARVDGGMSVYDPGSAERLWPDDDHDLTVLATNLSRAEVFDGKQTKGEWECDGLIRDWLSWQDSRQEAKRRAFETLVSVLDALAEPDEPLDPDAPTDVMISGFVREQPTLKSRGGSLVPAEWSAGVRQVVALAYMLVWGWTRHVRTMAVLGRPPSTSVILLVDEVETHLHPKWQRRILPGLLDVMRALTGTTDVQVQLVVTTHSPLVLASLEPHFDPEDDALFTFERVGDNVALTEQVWAKQGDVINWLVSDSFGLRQARSEEAERAIEAAEKYMRGAVSELSPPLDTFAALDQELRRLLPGHDPFWPRWIVETKQLTRRAP